MLKKIIELSPPDSVGFADLNKALDRIKSINELINERKREWDSQKNLAAANAFVQKVLAQPHRHCIRDSKLRVSRADKSPLVFETRDVFLSSDVILIWDKTNPEVEASAVYFFFCNIEAENFHAGADEDCFSLNAYPSSFVFQAQNREEKERWVSEISGCITTLKAQAQRKGKLSPSVLLIPPFLLQCQLKKRPNFFFLLRCYC